MGHKRYGYLPKSKIWREIVTSLGGYTLGRTEISEISKNTLRQIQVQYSNLKNDPSINASFEFLVQVSLAFQKKNPLKYLKEKKILDKEELTLIRLAKGASKYFSELERIGVIKSEKYKNDKIYFCPEFHQLLK